MNQLVIYVGVAAGTGFIWSIVQFLKKYMDPTNTAVTKMSDFSWKKALGTTALNMIGAVAGLLGLGLMGTEASYSLAVACGLFGEQGLLVLENIRQKFFAGKTMP